MSSDDLGGRDDSFLNRKAAFLSLPKRGKVQTDRLWRESQRSTPVWCSQHRLRVGRSIWSLPSRRSLLYRLQLLRQFRNRFLRRTPMVLGLMAKKRIPDDIIARWTDPGVASADVRRDVLAYCRTRFDSAALIAATEKLRDFAGPVLIIWAPETNVMRREHGQQLTDLFPKGTLAEVDDAYVLIMLDQPQRTAELIGEFLVST